LENHADVARRVRDAIVARAPENVVAGGRARLALLIEHIIDAWIQTAKDRASGGSVFEYAARSSSNNRLLLNPLEPGLDNLTAEHRLFVAGRSMRDVEPSVVLKVRDPEGRLIANADDLA
jgi:hypothetical protein